MPRIVDLRFVACAALAAALNGQSPSPLFRVLEEHVPYDFRPLAALDFDLDGDRDLLAREGVLLNDGNGRFAPTPISASLAYYLFFSLGIATPDLDGDGIDDLLVRAQVGSAPEQWYPFAAAYGGLTELTAAVPLTFFSRKQLAPFDYDGDGDDDLLAAGLPVPPGVAPIGPLLLLNSGNLGFTSAVAALPTTGGADFVAVGDFDDDGDLDVFVADLSTSAAKFHLRNGSTYALVSAPLPANLTHLAAGVSGDFDGDGVDDVVLRLENSPSAVTAAADVGLRCVGGTIVTTVESSVHALTSLTAFDLNGDGKLDRVQSINYGGGTAPKPSLEIRSGLPTNAATPAAPLLSFSDGPVAGLAFDADGDGDVDLLCQRAKRTPRVFYNDGAGGLHEARGDASFAVSGGGDTGTLADVIVGDFDGDGDEDLARFVAAGCPGAPFAVLENDGHGQFPPAAVPAGCVSVFPSKGLAADFDGDGRDDVFRIAQPSNVFAAYHRSLPGGGFSNALVATELGIVTDFVVGDLDDDGDVDAAACFIGTNLLVRYVNDGAGSFARVALAVSAGPTGLRIADMNGDDVVDFVVAAAAGVVVVDGATQTSTTAVAGFAAARAEVGDLDGDGDPDLLVDGTPYLLQGGAYVGQPTLAGFVPPIAGPALPQALLDVDGDGDLDALAYTAVWRNASGVFSGPEPVPFPTVNVIQIVQTGFMPFYRAADFDRDGDVDLLDPTGRLIANISRHLSRGAPAAINRVGTLDVCGPPLQPFALFASASAFQQHPYVVPGWGNLFLVPDAAVYVGTWSFDANAGFGVPFAVPNVPALVGLDLYWQAILPFAGRITNVERTRILSL
jgi:hypothetical protein